ESGSFGTKYVTIWQDVILRRRSFAISNLGRTLNNDSAPGCIKTSVANWPPHGPSDILRPSIPPGPPDAPFPLPPPPRPRGRPPHPRRRAPSRGRRRQQPQG